MFCIVTVVGVHVLCCDSGTRIYFFNETVVCEKESLKSHELREASKTPVL